MEDELYGIYIESTYYYYDDDGYSESKNLVAVGHSPKELKARWNASQPNTRFSDNLIKWSKDQDRIEWYGKLGGGCRLIVHKAKIDTIPQWC